MRFRYIGIILFLVGLIFLDIATDPDAGFVNSLPFGVGLISHLLSLLIASSGVIFLWIIRKVFFDYPEANHRMLLRNALRTPEGSGYAIIGIGIHMLAFAVVIYAILQ